MNPGNPVLPNGSAGSGVPVLTTAGTYSSTLFFDGSLYGLDSNDLIAIDLP